MYTEKKLSLIERKKLQWAQEREELAGLNVPWGRDIQLLRSRNVSKVPHPDEISRREPHSRRDSLPPLYRNQHLRYASAEKLDKEMGGETSGYGSDNANNSPERCRRKNEQQKIWNHALGYESSSSAREDRLKWGDRGMHVGKFWEPKEIDNCSKSSDTPGWVKRGLEGNTELVVSNTSPAESPEQDYMERDRPGTGSTSSQLRSYIRGQNVPVEPVELAEREKRRQMALAHQDAIRQQLLEREQRRKDERERRLREEHEEQARIERENELERQRKEKEQQLLKEKTEREIRRKEALREAIELAEKQAKNEKLRQRKLKQNDVNMMENIVDKESRSPRSVENRSPDVESVKAQIAQQSPNNKNKESLQNNLNNVKDTNKTAEINEQEYKNMPPLQLPPANSQVENLALVFQTPYETFQNMQFAVLMPHNAGGPATALPIAVPLTIATDRSTRTENRILTPSLYRNKTLCDSSTQTETSDFVKKDHVESNSEKYVQEKFSNIELNYDNRNRKERRMRIDDRTRENTEERPKWGVNRPPTRYMKQSEKDPLYQRRKLRQKMRQGNGYGDRIKNYSSDDSQTGSPRTHRKKGRALWRKNDELFAQNVRIYQTEIVPLETDRDQIYYKEKPRHQCCCRCRENEQKYPDHIKVVDILKIDHSSPRQCRRYKNESKNQLPDYINNNVDSSDTFESTAKQHWENSRQTPSPYLQRRNSGI